MLPIERLGIPNYKPDMAKQQAGFFFSIYQSLISGSDCQGNVKSFKSSANLNAPKPLPFCRCQMLWLKVENQ
jgi:hypothetical protein